MMMVPAYQPEQDGPSSAMTDALPTWQEAGELEDHREYIFHYHTMMCPQFSNGFCPRHKVPRSAPCQCFCYHFESQRRRPLVDTLTGQLRYWDLMCEYVAEGEECPHGDQCLFAHTREEISYHAAKYKTKPCNDRDCRGQEVCCFAHGEGELRTNALERYSYWSLCGSGNNYQAKTLSPPVEASTGRNNSTGTLYHPKVYKHRFCASYPHVMSCRRGESCAFAHSRQEIRTPLLTPEEEDQRPVALTNDFFMYRFKTLWCPVGVQHDWQTCVYAHNYQDARRHPGIGYGPRPCPYWRRKETALEYNERCPLGVCCPFSHGAKEQLYHPAYFKTVTCQDWPNAKCPRSKLCAFWHKRSQQRSKAVMEEDFDYKRPLPEQRVKDSLQFDFLAPPFKLLHGYQPGEGDMPPAVEGAERTGAHDSSNDPSASWPAQMLGDHCLPTTPTTTAITDSDEAASAGSTDGSDKIQSPQEEDGNSANKYPAQTAEASAWSAEAQPDMAWMQGHCGNGFGPVWPQVNMNGFAPQCAGMSMMYYVQVPAMGPGMGQTNGAPSIEQAMQMPMTMWAQPVGGFGYEMVCPANYFVNPMQNDPNAPVGARIIEVPYDDQTMLALGNGRAAGRSIEGEGTFSSGSAIPTVNGFIHFKEDEKDPETEYLQVGRRPRSSSH